MIDNSGYRYRQLTTTTSALIHSLFTLLLQWNSQPSSPPSCIRAPWRSLLVLREYTMGTKEDGALAMTATSTRRPAAGSQHLVRYQCCYRDWYMTTGGHGERDWSAFVSILPGSSRVELGRDSTSLRGLMCAQLLCSSSSVAALELPSVTLHPATRPQLSF